MLISSGFTFTGGHLRHRMTCDQCGREFESGRQHTKYCGPNCRKAASRRKEQIRRSANKAIAEIRAIQSYTKKYEGLEMVGAVELERILSELQSVTAASVTL